MKTILILTGEVSGDMHASYLLKSIKNIVPDVQIYAVGSDKLRSEGAEILEDLTKRSTIGLLEAIRHIPALLRLKKKLVRFMNHMHIDAVVCVDYQGFNMVLAAEARKRNIPVIYYIPPQEWVWGSTKGMQIVLDRVDLLIAIFREEYDAYRRLGEHVRYFGHPLIQIIEEYQQQQDKPVKKENNLIAVFPGSRKQEIKYVFPEMIQTMKELLRISPDYRFLINLPNKQYEKRVRKATKSLSGLIEIQTDRNYESLLRAEFALVTSGTICLEAMILGVPHCVLYRFNSLSYPIVKYILNKKFKYQYYSLTNILAEHEIVHEYLQDLNPIAIAKYIHQLCKNKAKLKKLSNELIELRQKLQKNGKTHIVDDAAQQIIEFI